MSPQAQVDVRIALAFPFLVVFLPLPEVSRPVLDAFKDWHLLSFGHDLAQAVQDGSVDVRQWFFIAAANVLFATALFSG